MPKKGIKKGIKPVDVTSKIPADTIILGFTGSIGSGCSYIAAGIAEYYGYQKFTLSDILRKLAKEKGVIESTENLQNIGNDLRLAEGDSALIKRLFEDIDTLDVKKKRGIIVDSIRNDGEIYVLKQFPYFYLFSIHADREVRQKRTVGPRKRFQNEEEFNLADERDKAENYSYGQQVERCNDLSDIIINNNDDFPGTNKTQKKQFIDKIHDSYISLIENKKSHLIIPERRPTADETLMTMAYAESQRSSCLKRKVGCVIASVSDFEGGPNAISESVQVVSSGHNEVPTGSVPCIFIKEYEKCYRDFLQEKQAEKIKYCPNCGKEIKLAPFSCKCGEKIDRFLRVCPACKSEIAFDFTCKCNKKIYKEYLLGGGKLLDMCRALHAEENALINLAKVGSLNSTDIVLYTTTYPCNLCANKIVSVGIKKVVYADPYTMEDAKGTLKIGKVETKKFEGIKSSAYFRLYK